MSPGTGDKVSRRKFERELKARQSAEKLLEEKSRELYFANQKLSAQAEHLEATVLQRTSELQTALEKAEAASAMRSRFVATMSHEIRTPLGGLLGMIDLMLGDETDPSKLEYLEYAKTSGQALKRIVNDVLDFSKMEAGAFQFQNEKVDIRALIGGVVAMAQANMPNGSERLSSTISTTVPVLFSGDATRMRQVISNLVNNACRYSTEGPIYIRALSKNRPDGVLLRVEVEDRGVGIPEEEQENLFKDFTQIQNKLTTAAQGTGLGLAISKRIIEGIGGVIGVDSAPGKGSTFWFEVPVKVVEETADDTPKPDLTNVDPDTTRGARILLVEDNQINQKLLLSFLKRMGVEAELAENGQVAIEKFEPGRYDLILMDVAMPVMDGLQAVRLMRKTWTTEQIPPIALLTAHVMESIFEEGESVGVDRVLSKPIAYDDLQNAIAELLHIGVTLEQTEESLSALGVMKLMSAEAADSLSKTLPQNELMEFISEFVVDARSQLEKLVNNAQSGDLAAVSATAHSLKGSAGLIGFAQISEIAAAIEDSTEDLDQEIFAEMLGIISEHLDDIENSLKAG